MPNAKVFDGKSTFQIMAIQEQLYELMRLWLFGTWMADQIGKQFHLVNLVCETRELDIERRFQRHLKHTDLGQFSRMTWESIFDFVNGSAPKSAARDLFLEYFTQKTAGYGSNFQLVKAFGRLCEAV